MDRRPGAAGPPLTSSGGRRALGRVAVVESARVLLLELDHASPPGRLLTWLQDAGLDVDVCDLAAGDALPEDRSRYGGIVVLGGKMGAGDDAEHPFLAEIRALLRAVVSDGTPTLGVCLGAQLLAAANGGRVREDPDGPELGAQLIAKRSAAAQDPLFGPLPITPDVIQWHFDTISTLPPRRGAARQLAGVREPGVPARPAGLGHPVPHRDHARDRAGLGPRRRRALAGLRPRPHHRPRSRARTTTSTRCGRPSSQRFADVVRDPSSVAGASRRTDVDGRAADRPGGDPRRARGRGRGCPGHADRVRRAAGPADADAPTPRR